MSYGEAIMLFVLALLCFAIEHLQSERKLRSLTKSKLPGHGHCCTNLKTLDGGFILRVSLNCGLGLFLRLTFRETPRPLASSNGSGRLTPWITVFFDKMTIKGRRRSPPDEASTSCVVTSWLMRG